MKSPFKFLDAYTLQDKDAFFGRDLEVETLYTLVFKTPLLLVYGLSGTGKTSLIQCGLASKFDGPDWYPVFIRRNENINLSLNRVMTNSLGNLIKDNPVENISLLIRKTLRPVYLLFDQMEELFILGKEDEQLKFMTTIRQLLDAQLPCKIIFIMREEYIGQLYSFEQMIPELFDHRFRVEPMGPTKVKNVIRSSFEKFNIHLAEPKEELLETMVQNISDPRSGITLPYLQVYLDMIYRDKYKKQFPAGSDIHFPKIEITNTEIASIGKIDNVLERFLEDQVRELHDQLAAKYKNVPSNVVQTLLDVFVSDEGTKRPISYTQNGTVIALTDPAAAGASQIPPDMLREMLDSMQQDRILRRTDDHFELAHDSLALIIDGKRSEYQRQLQNVRKRLMNAFDEYNKTGAFLNQRQLASFEEYLPYLGLSTEIKTFLTKCEEDVVKRAADEKDRLQAENQILQQKKLARTRKTWLVVATILGATAGVMAYQATTKADKLNDEKIKLAEQTTISEQKADSIKTILTQVDGQFGRMDSIVRGELADVELGMTVIKLKSLVKGKHANLVQANLYLSMISMVTSAKPGQPLSESRDEKVFTPSSDVHVIMHMKTPLSKEYIQVKWWKDSIMLGDPIFIRVASGEGNEAWISSVMNIKENGNYRVEVYNSLGVKVASKDLKVEGQSESESSLSSKDNFFTTTNLDVSKSNPGVHQTTFKVNEPIHYFARIYCPVDYDNIKVVMIDQDGKSIWNGDKERHDIAKNTNPGYRIWGANVIKEAGTYYIKLVNRKGTEIGGFEIVVK